jgi:hypothetical protein
MLFCTRGLRVPSLNQVHVPTEQLGQLNLNPRHIEQGYPPRFIEGGEQVNIGVRPAIASRGGTEQG